MQIHRISYRVKGFVKVTDYAIRLAYMITEKAKHKAKVLTFWQEHGTKAATEAFDVARRTLYDWKKKQKEGAENWRS